MFQTNAQEPRSFQFSDVFLNHVVETSDYTNFDPAVDIVFIVGSCLSEAATQARGVSKLPRVVEILAACDCGMSTFGNAVGARTQNRTFSAKIASIVAEQKSRDEPLSFAEIMAVIRSESPAVKPFYQMLLGSSSVGIPFANTSPSASTSSLSPSPPTTTTSVYRVVFSVHIPGTPVTDDKLREFANWVHSLDRSMPISVDAVYHANSIGLVMEAPYHVYAQLSSRPGAQLLFEKTSGNQLA